MDYFVHNEDSLSNILFSELYYHNKFEDLINKIQWDKDNVEIPKSIKLIDIHHQLSLSEFGRPDVVLVITDNMDKKYAFIIEAKVDTYKDSCDDGDKDCFDINSSVSKINNQITLRYRAFNAIDSIEKYQRLTEEETYIKNCQFYKNDRVRRCHKQATIEVLKKLNKNFYGFYLISLTGDDENPLANKHIEPLFERRNESKLKGLGSLTWKICTEIFEGVENSIFIKTYEKFNNENKSRKQAGRKQDVTSEGEIEYEDEEGKNFGSGVKMIYSKELDQNTFLHFSWAGNSAALRDYSKENINPDKDVRRDKTTTEIIKLIEKQDDTIEHRNRLDKKYWAERTRELNLSLLGKI